MAPENYIKVTCVSDLHGDYPELPGGDLLIIAGDLTSDDSVLAWIDFYCWLKKQRYKKKVYIGGNHDNTLVQCVTTEEGYEITGEMESPDEGEYLCDSGTTFQGMKIWGSPWIKEFPYMNPRCKAFTLRGEEKLANKFEQIPHDVDILITHSPPHMVMDKTNGMNVGCHYLRGAFEYVFRPTLWVFGHIHESYGMKQIKETMFVNAAHMNRSYEPINEPITLMIPCDKSRKMEDMCEKD